MKSPMKRKVALTRVKITITGMAYANFTTSELAIHDLVMEVEGLSPVEWGSEVLGKKVRRALIEYLKEQLEIDDE